MMVAPRQDLPCKSEDLERFCTLVARRLGDQFGSVRRSDLAKLLKTRLAETRLTAQRYLADLEATPDGEETRHLAERMTVTETYFFRVAEQFHAFAQIALTERLRLQRPLRVLSAGCASGEEPWTLALVAADVAPGGCEIVACDVNPRMLAHAKAGRYGAWSLRTTDTATQERCFRKVGKDHVVAEHYRESVRFFEHNLLNARGLAAEGKFDVIFCRNVIMYFSPDQARQVLATLVEALQPGGWLFLGHAETLRDLSDAFEVQQSHGAFYYRLRDANAPAARDVQGLPPSPEAAPPALDWATAIQAASVRIAGLPREASPTQAQGWSLAPALALLAGQRFAEALAHLDTLPTIAQHDLQVLELRAVLLTDLLEPHSHQATPERVCARILELQVHHGGAHFLLALCREHAGDSISARARLRIAATLWPDFAMAHVHLGMLAQRSGDVAGARAAFRQAELLLDATSDETLLLYGGGFSRASLLALCRSRLTKGAGR